MTMKKVIKELYELEQKHKTQLDKATHQKIIIKRGQLSDLMEQETRKVFKNVAKERYKWGNKPGKYLAKISKEKKTQNYIEKIKNGKGEIKYKTTDIAEASHYLLQFIICNKK